ncbi:MAG: hypothetical protein M3115_05070 [Thermoproteota archaeon]|nr:hypothetical protein [Thermoproteota archaeon]
MSSSQESGGGEGLSLVQIFALATLYYEESKQREREEMLERQRDRTQPPQSDVLPNPVSVMVRDLCSKIPYSINSETLTAEQVCNQMESLVERGLLEQVFKLKTGEFATFTITADGMLVINRILGKLSQQIEDKKITEQDIDRAEADSGAKEYLKGMWNNFVDKSQNEILEMLFSAIRTQGLPFALLLINLSG